MVSEERRVFLKEGAICSGCKGTCNVQIIKRNLRRLEDTEPREELEVLRELEIR